MQRYTPPVQPGTRVIVPCGVCGSDKPLCAHDRMFATVSQVGRVLITVDLELTAAVAAHRTDRGIPNRMRYHSTRLTLA
jgi:hypothetical protein